MPKRQKGINKMKKNIFKKIVASLATVAMAAGLFTAMPAEEAKATDSTDKTVYLVVDEAHDEYNWAMNYWNGVSTGATQVNVGWDKTLPSFVKVQDGLYKMNITVWGDMKQDGNGIQIVAFLEEGSEKGAYEVSGKDGKTTYWNDVYAAFSGAEKDVWIALDYDAWTVKTTSPVEIKKTDADFAKEAEAVIDEAIALDATKANKAKYDVALGAYNALSEAQKALVDSAKVTKLNAGVKAINDILEAEQAAADAKAAGTLTVYVKSPGWTSMNVYGWDGAEFGEWPGKTLTPLTKNKGWFSVSFDITKKTNLIFNDSKKDGAEQTVNWEGVEAGTYWLVLSEKADNGQYKVDNVSTKAPTGWQEEAAEKVENKAPVKTTTDKGSVATKDDIAKIDKEAVVEGAPEGAKLDATEIAADSDAFKVVKEAAKTAFKNKVYVALDLKLLKGTEAVQPNGDVKVTIPVPSALAKAKKVAVYRVGDNNKLVSCGTADVANGKLTFTTNHFSTYVFADATPATNTGDAAPIVFMLAVAAVAASMVIASKKKTICE